MAFAATQWGQQTNDRDENGNVLYGTSGVEKDVDRYRAMAGETPQSGPAIDQRRPDETRAMGMGSLGLLGATAAGATPSAAEALSKQQTRDAQAAQYSMGASVRGGAMARAAAARSANMGAVNLAQVGAQQRQALRAGEMASARDAYFGAASGMRGQDLGIATDQAKLDAAQRNSNEQRDQFYEGLGFGTKKAGVDAALGRSAADEAASNASRTQALNEQRAERQRTDQTIGTIGAAGSGGVNGYMASQSNGVTPPPQHRPGLSTYVDPYANTGSDERMKQDVVPLYESAGTERHWDRDVSKAPASPDAVSGASLSGPTPKYSSAPREQAAPKAKPTPKATRKRPNDDLMRIAREMLGAQETQSAAQLGAGPSVGGYEASRDLMASDDKAKALASGAGPMAEANRAMAPSSYEYKPGFAEQAGQTPGERNVGPMAQKMASDPVAGTAIVKDPKTGLLAIDKAKGLKVVMGGLSSLQQEVDELRKRAR